MTSDEPESWEQASTQDLLLAAQEGRRAAREELFARYRPRVLALARGRLGRQLRRALDSQDLVQEALTEAVQNLERFEYRGESSLIRWLSRLLEHRATANADKQSALKRDARREVSLEEDGAPVAQHAATDSDDDPQRVASRNEDEERLRDALHLLPERYREAILLRDYGGCSWEEIALELGLATPSAARMLHVRAVTRLGKLLAQ